MAPSFRASSRRYAIGSTTMIREAPFTSAPITADRPTGPAPKITTSEATSTGAFVIVMPRPHPETQVSIEISTAEASVKSGVACSSPDRDSDIAPVRPNTGMPLTSPIGVLLAVPARHLSERIAGGCNSVRRPRAVEITRSPTRC